MSVALAYHEHTKYHPDTIGSGPAIDWSAKPSVFKTFADLDPVELAPFLPMARNPFTGEAISPTPVTAGMLDVPWVSRWLYGTYGVTAVIPQPERPVYLRAAPSAGGLYPAEITLLVREVAGLAPGCYGFSGDGHRLHRLPDQPLASERVNEACYRSAAVADAPMVAIITAVFQRSTWRYHERAYRRILLDTGHLIGNASLMAQVLGMRTHVTSAFGDGGLESLLALDTDQEGVLAVVSLLPAGAPVPRPNWSSLPSLVLEGMGDAAASLLDLHVASRLPDTRPALMARDDRAHDTLAMRYALGAPEDLTPRSSGRLRLTTTEEFILHRRSTRRFVRGARAGRDQLGRILQAGYQPEQVGFQPDPGVVPRRIATFVAACAIDGLTDGVYYVSPHSLQLLPLNRPVQRERLQWICLGQDLGGDAVAIVLHTAELPRCVQDLGERAYRDLHLDAGIIGERLNLAALAEGLGASGIAGFFDDDVNEVFGLAPEEAVLYMTVIGVPG